MVEIYKGRNRRKTIRRKHWESLRPEKGMNFFLYTGKSGSVGGFDERERKERRKPTLKGFKLQLGEIKKDYEKITRQRIIIERQRFLKIFRDLNEAKRTANALLMQYKSIKQYDTTEVRARIHGEIRELEQIRAECERIDAERK
ncbi:MAG: hypothetical protein PHD95_06020 [Candidatus ainarchaeum sp.]|nr:hypothetical protein [Candidatus ainarchaeum sp.]